MLRYIICLLPLAVVAVTASWEEGYDGFKFFEVLPKNKQQADFLHELSKIEESYDFFTLRRIPNQPAHVMVHHNEIENLLNKLKHQNISFRILNEDVGRTIEKHFNLNKLRRHLKPISPEGHLSTDRYYNLTEINNYIGYLAKRYPSRVVVRTVGKSFEGREIKTIAISNGDGRSNKNVILIDSGIHAREWIAHSTILYVIEQLVEKFEENADLLLNHDIVIMPVVNPDGYEYTHLSSKTRFWRKTRQPFAYKKKICYGSDPNRNFGFHWNEGGASPNPCSETYAGPHAFSEPEAAVLRDLIHSLKGRAVMYLTLHSFGNYLIYPWGWTADLPDNVEELDEIALVGASAVFNATGTVYKTGSSTNTMYVASGGSDDYAYSVGYNISITMELAGEGNNLQGFDPHPSRIDGMVKEGWIGIRAMVKRIVEKYSPKSAAFL